MNSLTDLEEPRTMWHQVLRRQPMPLALLSTYPEEAGLN